MGLDKHRRDRRQYVENDPLARNRVLHAWEMLATDGADLEWRQRRLRNVGSTLIDRRDLEISGAVYQTIQWHLWEAGFEDVQRRARIANLAHVEDAKRARATKKTLRVLQRLHRESASHKWYGHPDVGPLAAFRSAADVYDQALRTIDQDPLVRFLTKQPFEKARPGNPLKTRNKKLRDALREHGLSRTQISTILSAIGFVGR